MVSRIGLNTLATYRDCMFAGKADKAICSDGDNKDLVGKDITENNLGDEALLNRAVRASQLRDRIRQYEQILGEALGVCHQHVDVAVQAFRVASAVQDDDEVYDGVFA